MTEQLRHIDKKINNIDIPVELLKWLDNLLKDKTSYDLMTNLTLSLPQMAMDVRKKQIGLNTAHNLDILKSTV